MFNPDLKKMLDKVNSRYSLVVGTAKRAREIRDEALENEKQIDEKTVLQLQLLLLITHFLALIPITVILFPTICVKMPK